MIGLVIRTHSGALAVLRSYLLPRTWVLHEPISLSHDSLLSWNWNFILVAFILVFMLGNGTELLLNLFDYAATFSDETCAIEAHLASFFVNANLYVFHQKLLWLSYIPSGFLEKVISIYSLFSFLAEGSEVKPSCISLSLISASLECAVTSHLRKSALTLCPSCVRRP